jgi:two-component system sensor histidine kinase PilS (NtrC family)
MRPVQLLKVGSDRRVAEALGRGRLLYFIYGARLVVCLAVFGSALLVGGGELFGTDELVDPATGRLALAGLVLAGVATVLAYSYSHVREQEPGDLFLYSQALLDVLLVTGIVHVTGGSESVFPPLFYIGLASGYALVLPLVSALGLALLSGVAYLADIALAYPGQLGLPVFVQVVIFTVVASVASLIGARLRQMRAEVRRLEGELHRLRLEAADVLRNVASGVLTLDGEGRVAYLNPAASELVGVDADAWLGRDLMAELERRAPGVVGAVRETFRREDGVQNREVEVRHPGERAVPVSVTTTFTGRADAPPSVTVALQDLRPARRLQELRVRAGRLEAVAELSASLAHEIKNPLASIRSAAQQLSDSGESKEVLTRLMVRESDRLSSLLEEFGDFARVDVSQRRPLELRELARQAVEVVRQHPDTTEEARFEIEVADEPGDLWGDPDLLYRLIMNLCLNAVQAAEPGEPLTVRIVVDELRPDFEPSDASLGSPVRIRVIDDGPGIPPEELERIFDPFYSRREGGSGLGLSIAHRAAEAHGGALFATSTPGEGATFVLVLPRRGEERTGDEGPDRDDLEERARRATAAADDHH